VHLCIKFITLLLTYSVFMLIKALTQVLKILSFFSLNV